MSLKAVRIVAAGVSALAVIAVVLGAVSIVAYHGLHLLSAILIGILVLLAAALWLMVLQRTRSNR